MSKIENIKTYNGLDLDNIFFRPMLTGPNAEQLGIKVMYNMPVPTVLHFWQRKDDVLSKYSSGWNGRNKSSKYQKTIKLSKVKAEMAYSADDYFSTVYELITGRSDVNLDDLSGTELEAAETKLFRDSIAEGIRSTMWYGNLQRDNQSLATFDGVVTNLMTDIATSDIRSFAYMPGDTEDWAERLLNNLWKNATDQLKALRSEEQLAFFVSTDVYNAYEEQLDNVALEAAYLAKQTGRSGLFYRGIPVVDVQLNGYHNKVRDLPHSFAILTDRRNIALAVNTNDFPGTEVKMWYNPDLMENRQRAIFMAGCDYMLPELVCMAVGLPLEQLTAELVDGKVKVSAEMKYSETWLDSLMVSVIDEEGEYVADEYTLTLEGNRFYGEFDSTSLKETSYVIQTSFGSYFTLL